MRYQDLPRGRPGTSVESGGSPRSTWLDPSLLSKDFWAYGPGKIFLGATENGAQVGIRDDRHLLTVAGSRAGKGRSAIVPNLLRYEGSVLVLDPKGENATLTAERRGFGRDIPQKGMNQSIHVIDPFGVANVREEYRSTFNPLATLNPDGVGFIDDCDAIADALVISGEGQESFWTNSAKLVLRGIVAWVASGYDNHSSDRNLGEVFNILNYPKVKLQGYLSLIQTLPDIAQGAPARASSFLLGMEDRTFSNLMATVLEQISFLESPEMRQALSGNGRKFDHLTWKFDKASVYVCLPAMRLHRHSRFFRLLVNALVSGAAATDRKPDIPALVILDEMHVLGHMSVLETAAGLIAGYGVRLWSIWQDFAQLKSIYRDRWETFLGNASILQAFGLNDLTTLEYMSRRLGVSPTLQISQGQLDIRDSAAGFTGQTTSLQESPLLTVDEIARFFSRQESNQLLIYPGAGPIFLKRVGVDEDAFKEFRREEVE